VWTVRTVPRAPEHGEPDERDESELGDDEREDTHV
jgi:hypothetical protein